MYKLMVVDDEQLPIESVKFIVEKDIKNIEISDTARSGREAIEKSRYSRPDIILMDIRMPGIDGLETIKEISKIHKNIKFVIISAYEYFDFAKQAVELGVDDYMTKPVNKFRLIETLEKVTNKLDDERKKFDRELENKEKMERMLNVVEHSFIYSLLLSRGEKIDIGKYKDLFNIKSERGYIFILKMVEPNKSEASEIRLSNSIKIQTFYSYFKDRIKYKTKCIVGPIMLDRVIVYVSESIDDEYRQRVEAIEIIENIIGKLESKYELDFEVGIGGIKEDTDIIFSYQEALRALNSSIDGNITHIKDVALKAIDLGVEKIGYEILNEEQKLITAIERGEPSLCIRILSDIFNKYPSFFETENIRNRLVELMVVAHRIAIENGIASDEYIEYNCYIKQILDCENKHDFKRMCTEKIRYIANKIKVAKKMNIGAIVDKANYIISERFDQELTLDEISKELCVSPQYFSRLYKSEMDVNFIEQLTDTRIKNAKLLMEKNELSIKEICYKSGYSDPNYFSRLFKKHEGISPSAYMKKF